MIPFIAILLLIIGCSTKQQIENPEKNIEIESDSQNQETESRIEGENVMFLQGLH